LTFKILRSGAPIVLVYPGQSKTYPIVSIARTIQLIKYTLSAVSDTIYPAFSRNGKILAASSFVLTKTAKHLKIVRTGYFFYLKNQNLIALVS